MFTVKILKRFLKLHKVSSIRRIILAGEKNAKGIHVHKGAYFVTQKAKSAGVEGASLRVSTRIFRKEPKAKL